MGLDGRPALVRPVAHFLRRGSTETVTAPLRAGAQGSYVVPTATGSSLTAIRADGTALASAVAVSVVSSVASASLPIAAAEALGAGGDLRWTLVVDGVAHHYSEPFLVCDFVPFNVISAAELYEARPQLRYHVPAMQEEAGVGWQPQIDRAFYDLLQRVLDSGHEPWQIREFVGARDWLEARALQRCVDAIEHGPDSMWATVATEARHRLRAAEARLKLQFRTDEAGQRRPMGGRTRLAPLRRRWF